MHSRSIFRVLALTTIALGCSSNDGTPAQTSSGGSGAVGTGGAGVTTVGGSATGGASTTNLGGAPGAGGTANGGSSSGSSSNGGAASGGQAAGGSATGGSGPANGGASGKGGNLARGGSPSGGGNSKGGSTSGGANVTGGATATGGANNAGAPGCNVTSPSATTGAQNLTIQVAGQDRAYVLFVPTTYTGATPMPLVFAWHGLGGSGTMARQYFGLERAASNQAILVYPTGLTNADGKTAWTLTSTGVDVQLFDALLADVSSKYCIDKSRVFTTGHSYGAMMTNALGCYRGHVLRAIAPVAGMPPFGNPTCTGAVAAWIAHGENDATVNFTTGGVATRDLWIKLDACSTTAAVVAVDPTPCVAYQECSAGHPVHWCVHQDNHNWPSFAGAGIWAFFNSFK